MITAPALLVLMCASAISGRVATSSPYAWLLDPTNTPTGPPRSVWGSMPARSQTSQAVSRINRCWGSMVSASRGDMPKKPGSKSPMSETKPPSCTYEAPGRSGSGVRSASRSQPRSDGKGSIASFPSATSRHRSSAERMPPG
ncbi:hypothetical protein GCM10018775_30890 [Streptomyces umbrinus]|nr:hypothetical protein GCM10018775_30890 [Streptomyces umbrinus]